MGILRNFNLFTVIKKGYLCLVKKEFRHYFRFAYAGTKLFPTQDVTAIFKKDDTKESIFYILAFLNNYRVFQWLIHNGIVKGNIVEFSERPIASIPFRKINWQNANEVKIHNNIVLLTKNYIENKIGTDLEKINKLFDELFK